MANNRTLRLKLYSTYLTMKITAMNVVMRWWMNRSRRMNTAHMKRVTLKIKTGTTDVAGVPCVQVLEVRKVTKSTQVLHTPINQAEDDKPVMRVYQT